MITSTSQQLLVPDKVWLRKIFFKFAILGFPSQRVQVDVWCYGSSNPISRALIILIFLCPLWSLSLQNHQWEKRSQQRDMLLVLVGPLGYKWFRKINSWLETLQLKSFRCHLLSFDTTIPLPAKAPIFSKLPVFSKDFGLGLLFDNQRKRSFIDE